MDECTNMIATAQQTTDSSISPPKLCDSGDGAMNCAFKLKFDLCSNLKFVSEFFHFNQFYCLRLIIIFNGNTGQSGQILSHLNLKLLSNIHGYT